MAATSARFDFKAWISRFGTALEDAAARARPSGVPFGIYGTMPGNDYRREMHRRYRELGALAKTDPYASKLFDESISGSTRCPTASRISCSSTRLSHGLGQAARARAFTSCECSEAGTAMSSSSLRTSPSYRSWSGGRHAATMLHRFLVAGAGVRLHAHEITVLHGLELGAPTTVGRGGFLASYDAVRERFGLPEDPEPWLSRRSEGRYLQPGRPGHKSSRSVFVRRVRWGPAVAPCDCPTGGDGPLILRYAFPDDHRVESITDVFEERETLVHLLGIAVRSKLVSHTVITAVPRWMSRLDPNYRTGSPGGPVGRVRCVARGP